METKTRSLSEHTWSSRGSRSPPLMCATFFVWSCLRSWPVTSSAQSGLVDFWVAVKVYRLYAVVTLTDIRSYTAYTIHDRHLDLEGNVHVELRAQRHRQRPLRTKIHFRRETLSVHSLRESNFGGESPHHCETPLSIRLGHCKPVGDEQRSVAPTARALLCATARGIRRPIDASSKMISRRFQHRGTGKFLL